MRVALLAAAVALGGCGMMYRPVPIRSAIGKERTTLAGDSFNVHRDPRFEIYGPGSQTVFDAYEQLNRTYRAFERYFAAPAPKISVLLYDESASMRDTAAEAALRQRSTFVLRYRRPLRASLRERVGDEGYGGSLWPVGPPATRVLIASLATGPIDTTTLARFPAWFRSAAMSIVGDDASLPLDVESSKENHGNLWSVEELTAMERPTAADSVLDPYVRDDASDRDRRFASEASAFMQFLLEREGPGTMAMLGRGFAKGERFVDLTARFRAAPRTLAELDQSWLTWLAAQRPIY